jgi:hypothetical protein
MSMTVIKVPRPPKSAFNPNRPVNTLLKTQIDFLHKAERRLPTRYHSEIYVNAIKTEGEASTYIREVTEAIHQAHADAAIPSRVRPIRKRKGVIEIAAVADERGARKRSSQKKSRATTKRKAVPKKSKRKK